MAPSVQSAVARYLVERSQRSEFRPQTVTTVRGVLHQFANHVGPQTPVEKLTRRQVRDWWASLALSPNTCRNRLSMVRTWNLMVHRARVVQARPDRRHPSAGRSPRQLPITLTHDEIQTLLQACSDDRIRLALLLMLQLGMRAGEVCGLQTGDVDLVTRLVRIEGKGGHQRIEPIPDELHMVLTVWLRQLSPGPVIRRLSGDPWKPLTRQYLGLAISRTMMEAGVKDRAGDMISAHALRRTAISDVLEMGAPLSAVQAFAGHANIASLRPYIRLRAGEELRSAVEGRSYLSPG